jgi:hypothetical protein
LASGLFALGLSACGQNSASQLTPPPHDKIASSALASPFACVSAPQVTTPSPPALSADEIPETQPTVCPSGQVPQPTARSARKGIPRIRASAPASVANSTSGGGYYYNVAYLFGTGESASGSFTQDKPYVAPTDYHSLAEIAGESANEQNIIEIGWTVDPNVNNGDANPHLFVYHWINASSTCYNACGYVQVSKSRYPGMKVTVTTHPYSYAVKHQNGRWYVGYQGEWIGYFPDSLWNGAFTVMGLTQWFGEVAAGSSPCTWMGDGIFGTQRGAAAISNEQFGAGGTSSPYSTSPYYAVGAISSTGFNFGGPGAGRSGSCANTPPNQN